MGLCTIAARRIKKVGCIGFIYPSDKEGIVKVGCIGFMYSRIKEGIVNVG